MTVVVKWNSLVVVLSVGFALRMCLFHTNAVSFLSHRPELTNPITSFHRVQESHYYGSQPYKGDIFHQPPLVLAFFKPFLVIKHQTTVLAVLFSTLQIVIAYVLSKLSKLLLQCEEKAKQEAAIPAMNPPRSYLLKNANLPTTVAAIYLFNPYTILSCIAMSTVSLSHVAIVLCFYLATRGKIVQAAFSLAIATYISVYSIALVVPAILMINQNTQKKAKKQEKSIISLAGVVFGFIFLMFVIGLLQISKILMGSWDFIHESYLWIIQYPDLTPNVGIFWYFFMEVFERFRNYFLLILHIHPFIYIAPFYIRLSNHPQALATSLIGVFSLFQAYPTMADLGFFLSLIAMHPRTIQYFRKRYVLLIGISVPSIMMPVMWYLWLYPASGNANFFYNQTLVYQLFVSLIISEFVGATMVRDKLLILDWKRQVSKLSE